MIESGRLKRGAWITVALSLAVTALIVARNSGETGRALLKANPLHLALAGAATGLAWFMRALRLRIVTGSVARKPGLWRLFRIYLAACFGANVTPFSSGGLPLQVFLLAREGLSYGVAAAVTVADLCITGLVFLVLAPTLLARVGPPGGIRGFWGILPVFGLGVFLGFVLWMAVGRRDPDPGRWLGRHPGIKRRVPTVVRDALRRAREEIIRLRRGLAGILRQSRLRLTGLFLTTLLYWAFYLSIAPLVLLALRQKVDWGAVVWRQVLITFLMPLVPTLGGSGGAEGMAFWFFGQQARGASLGAFVVLWRFYTFHASLAFGGMLLPGLLEKGNSPEAAPEGNSEQQSNEP